MLAKIGVENKKNFWYILCRGCDHMVILTEVTLNLKPSMVHISIHLLQIKLLKGEGKRIVISKLLRYKKQVKNVKLNLSR